MGIIAYLRCSTESQVEARQEEIINSSAYGNKVDKYFIDFQSGASTNRPEFIKMKQYLRSSDILVVTEASRVSRNVKELLEFIDFLDTKGVALILLKENLSTEHKNPQNRFMLQILAAVAEMELNYISERTKDAAVAVKKRGGYTHRPATKIAEFTNLVMLYEQRKLTKTEMAKRLKISRPTLSRLWIAYEMSLKAGIDKNSQQILITLPMSYYDEMKKKD